MHIAVLVQDETNVERRTTEERMPSKSDAKRQTMKDKEAAQRQADEVQWKLDGKAAHVQNELIDEFSDETTLCVICNDQSRCIAFSPCGHDCVCAECGPLLPVGAACPLCRSTIQSTLKIYL